ncbi:hypothetical protein NZJ93_04995 [Desulfofundulus thermocisternus]|nr:hypothetical protein [Desulfofundulus thermocisternus]
MAGTATIVAVCMVIPVDCSLLDDLGIVFKKSPGAEMAGICSHKLQ